MVRHGWPMCSCRSASIIHSKPLPRLGAGQAGLPLAPSPKGRRLRIWQVRDGLQCSIVGTCLMEADLASILKRCKVRFDPPLRPYEPHGYFVDQISRESQIAKAVQKLLDRRSAGGHTFAAALKGLVQGRGSERPPHMPAGSER